jgi:hypothetical protein
MAPAFSSEAADGFAARHREETSDRVADIEPLNLHIGTVLRRTNRGPFKLFASNFRPGGPGFSHC